MQQGDYPSSYSSSSYYQYPHLPPNPNPNPNPIPAPNPNANPSPNLNPNPNLNLNPNSNLISHASAPPFSDYSQNNHQPYPHAPDPIPPSATAPASSFPAFYSHDTLPYHQPQQSYYSPPLPFNRPHQHPIPPSPPYSIATDPSPNSTFAPPFSALIHSAPAPPSYAPPAPTYDPQFENVAKYEQFYGGGYDRSGSGLSDYGTEVYGKRPDLGGYDSRRDDGYGEGVYGYQGGKTEPYGARGTVPKSWSGSSGSGLMFDDYGRPMGSGSGGSGKDSSFGAGSAA